MVFLAKKSLLNTCLLFSWFVNLSTSAGFFSWLAMNVTYIRFCASFCSPLPYFTLMTKICSGRGHKVQGRDRRQLAYWSALQPGLAIWGAFWTSVFILVDGYQSFFKWNTQDFLTAYINIPIFFALWLGWSLYMRRPFWRAHEMDFVTVRQSGRMHAPACYCSRV
jgi:amino acid transporter